MKRTSHHRVAVALRSEKTAALWVGLILLFSLPCHAVLAFTDFKAEYKVPEKFYQDSDPVHSGVTHWNANPLKTDIFMGEIPRSENIDATPLIYEVPSFEVSIDNAGSAPVSPLLTYAVKASNTLPERLEAPSPFEYLPAANLTQSLPEYRVQSDDLLASEPSTLQVGVAIALVLLALGLLLLAWQLRKKSSVS